MQTKPGLDHGRACSGARAPEHARPDEAGSTRPARHIARPRLPSGLRVRRADFVAALVFVACALALFRLSLLQEWTFIGDSDRLNTALNVRLFETEAIRARGSVPTWSGDQFMGYSIVSLHWLLTAFTPVPYLLALLPPADMYHALAVLAATLLALTMGTAYWALGAYSTGPVPRVVGALLYGLGSYTVHKVTQLDVAFVALAASPLLLRLVRETRRDTAVRSFALIAATWAGLVLFTVLQELAYVGLLCGTFALYRSVRTRDPWPVLVIGLAVGCGTAIGLPRVLTIAAEFPLVARTSTNIEWQITEALRYFGDGLLGRTPREQGMMARGLELNLHEGIQLLHSTLAALAVLVAGLLARSWVARLWAVVLALVLSIALVAWNAELYASLGDSLGLVPFISQALHVFLVNVVLIGLPLWLVGWWLARRAASVRTTGALARVEDETPAARADAPFFLGFVALGMAAILIPEARTVLYVGFMRIDLQHARLSVAMTLPLAALATIFVSRFLPTRTGRSPRRWLVAGLALGLVLWLVREAGTNAMIDRIGPVVNDLKPRRLLTLETARLVTSLVLLLLAVAVLLVRRAPPALRTVVGGMLAVWMALETVVTADFKLNGPDTREHPNPFESLNYMSAPPGLFNVPSPEQRAALRERLETDRYRTVLQQDNRRYAAHVEPHLATFWDLRLVEGYSTGLPRRLAALPWARSMYGSHFLDLDASHVPPWRLLAALNVKYVVVVNHSLWYNPALGAAVPPLNPETLPVIENPYPVTPRAFFAARVSPAGDQPRFPGDDGVRPPTMQPHVDDPVEHSLAEGLFEERRFSTAGTPAATFDGDRVLVRVDAAAEDRFLVLNEMAHPAWRAWIDGQPAEIYPTNLVMRGILVPAGATTVELHFIPFMATPYGIGLLVAALVGTVLTWWGLRRYLATTAPRSSSNALRARRRSRRRGEHAAVTLLT